MYSFGWNHPASFNHILFVVTCVLIFNGLLFQSWRHTDDVADIMLIRNYPLSLHELVTDRHNTGQPY